MSFWLMSSIEGFSPAHRECRALAFNTKVFRGLLPLLRSRLNLQCRFRHRSSLLAVFLHHKYRSIIGWGGRIRTSDCEIQNLVTCRLSTPHTASDLVS